MLNKVKLRRRLNENFSSKKPNLKMRSKKYSMLIIDYAKIREPWKKSIRLP